MPVNSGVLICCLSRMAVAVPSFIASGTRNATGLFWMAIFACNRLPPPGSVQMCCLTSSCSCCCSCHFWNVTGRFFLHKQHQQDVHTEVVAMSLPKWEFHLTWYVIVSTCSGEHPRASTASSLLALDQLFHRSLLASQYDER